MADKQRLMNINLGVLGHIDSGKTSLGRLSAIGDGDRMTNESFLQPKL